MTEIILVRQTLARLIRLRRRPCKSLQCERGGDGGVVNVCKNDPLHQQLNAWYSRPAASGQGDIKLEPPALIKQ